VILPLVRRWAVDWLSAHNPDVLPEILAEAYVLHIGSLDIRGVDAYADAVMGQLRQFPGLVLTVHDVLGTRDRAAIRFTEHGASTADDGRAAAWGGIALFRSEDNRLTATYAQEDYLSRRRQLRSGVADPVEAPHVAPWDVAAADPDPAAEAVVRAWLATDAPDLDGRLVVDDAGLGHQAPPPGRTGALRVDELFSAGSRVAVHATQQVEPEGGDHPVEMGLSAILEVADGAVVGGRAVRDRLGATRRPPRPVAS
jgi:hypothetical protein